MTSGGRILVVDDEPAITLTIRRLLMRGGHEVDTAASADEAIEHVGRVAYHLVITDLNLAGQSGLDVLRAVRERRPDTAVIMITAFGSERIAVEAMKLGATDYLPKPFDNDELEIIVQRALERHTLERDVALLRDQVASTWGFENIVGKSAPMRRVFDVISKVADTDLTVLVRGPSGTGKELVANALHQRSRRRNRPLVKVNCAAFSRDLVESELFGHEKGAFTGAAAAREGKFETADGGTLFLDEIGDMALETQAKILRVLQERELQRVGGNRTIRVDVRVIAATNHDLEARVKAGAFREDLFYRLNVVTIALPALRDRAEDMPLLVERLLAQTAERLGRPARPLAPEAYRALLSHDWPGNVRELEHSLAHALALASGDAIVLDDLPPSVSQAVATSASTGERGALPANFRDAKQLVVERFERAFVIDALTRHEGNISRAAEEMGMYRQHLQQKLAEYQIDAEVFRRRS